MPYMNSHAYCLYTATSKHCKGSRFPSPAAIQPSCHEVSSSGEPLDQVGSSNFRFSCLRTGDSFICDFLTGMCHADNPLTNDHRSHPCHDYNRLDDYRLYDSQSHRSSTADFRMITVTTTAPALTTDPCYEDSHSDASCFDDSCSKDCQLLSRRHRNTQLPT